MSLDPLDRLSPSTRQVLRLVHERKTSKEIAIELNLSPHTVDDRLRTAIRILGVTTRAQAARLLIQREDGPQSLSPQSPQLQPLLSPRSTEGAAGILDAAASTSTADDNRGFGRPLRKRGERGNDLDLRQRLIWIGAITLLIIFSLGVLLAGLGAVSQLALQIINR